MTRAETPIGGWIFEPDPENPNRTLATLMIEIDFKGYMPDIAMTTAFKMQGYQIDLLRGYVPKFMDKVKHLV